MKRSQAAGTFIAVVMLSALNAPARGGDLVACEPQRVTGDGSHWAYRIIDGRECWYAGRPGKPKSELFWDRGDPVSVSQTEDGPDPELETETEPSEPPSRLLPAAPQEPQTTETTLEERRRAAADQLLASTCCWPQLEEPAPLPQLMPVGGQPPAWPLALIPLALLPLGLYALWRFAKPRRRLRVVRGVDRGRGAARGRIRPRRHNGHGTRGSTPVPDFLLSRARALKRLSPIA
jgi:hypothetical protein